MDLFKGKPYWPTTLNDSSLTSETVPDRCDVAIIGGGISGTMCAYVLTRAGYSAVLLDGDRIGHGSTSLNTGLIQYMSDDLMTELASTFNEATARSFYRASWQALALLESIAGELPGDPQFRRNGSLYIASDDHALAQNRKEASLQQGVGLPARWIGEAELAAVHHLKGRGALLTERDVELNPFQMTRFMARTAAERHGLTILENTRVNEEAIDRAGHVLRLPEKTLHYDRLIIATGYDVYPFVSRVLPQMQLISTFAVITAPLPEGRLIPTDRMVWESARPYLYFRTSADGRLIAGGSDETDTGLDEAQARQQADVLLSQILGILTRPAELIPEYWYQAIFAESRDGLPYMGPHPEDQDIFLLHGIGGNGTVYSAIGARLALQFMKDAIDPEFAYLFPGAERRLAD